MITILRPQSLPHPPAACAASWIAETRKYASVTEYHRRRSLVGAGFDEKTLRRTVPDDVAFREGKDRARNATARANSPSSRPRQHITISDVVPKHQIAPDRVLTEHHCHRIVNVRRRDIAVRVHIL